MYYFVGYDSLQNRYKIPYKLIGTGGFNQVRRQLQKSARQGKGEQLSLFTKPTVSLRPSSNVGNRTIDLRERESNYFSLLARNRAFTKTLLERVMSVTNLNQAYESVRRNGGASGVDRMDIKALKEWLSTNGQPLIEQVLTEDYEPNEVLGVEIPKPNGGVRLLGIPTVLDRLLQQAIHQHAASRC